LSAQFDRFFSSIPNFRAASRHSLVLLDVCEEEVLF